MLLTQLQKYQQINIVNFNHKIISFSSKYELQRLKNQCNKLNQNLIQVPYLYCISWILNALIHLISSNKFKTNVIVSLVILYDMPKTVF